MADSGQTAEDYLATKDNITRIPDGSVSSYISCDEEKHVHFGDEIVVQECTIDRLHRNGELTVWFVKCNFNLNRIFKRIESIQY